MAAATGDRTALAAIYDRYADRLYDFCLGMLRDREAAADCVQDVFVTAATKLGQPPPVAPVVPTTEPGPAPVPIPRTQDSEPTIPRPLTSLGRRPRP